MRFHPSIPALAAFVAPRQQNTNSLPMYLQWVPPSFILAEEDISSLDASPSQEVTASSQYPGPAPMPTPTATVAPRRAPLLSDFVKEWMKKETPAVKSKFSEVESMLQKQMKEIDAEIALKSDDFKNKVILETPRISQSLQSNLQDLEKSLEKEVKDIDWAGISKQVQSTVSSLESKIAEIQQEVARDDKVQYASKNLETKLLTGWKNDWRKLSQQVQSSTSSSSPEGAAERVADIRKAMQDMQDLNGESLKQYQAQAAKDLEEALTHERSRLETVYKEELNDIRARLDMATKSIASLKASHAEEIALLEKSNKETIATQEQTITSLQATDASRLQIIDQLEEQLAQVKTDYESRIGLLQQSQKENIEKLQQQLKDSLRSSEENYSSEKANLLGDTAEKMAQMEAAKVAAEDEKQVLQAQLRQIQAENEMNMKSLSSLSAELKQVTEEQSKLLSDKAIFDELQNQLEQAKVETSDTKREFVRVSEELEKARNGQSQALSALNNIEQEKVDLQKQLDQRQIEKSRDQEELMKISEDLDRVRAEQSKLTEAASNEARQEVIEKAREAFGRARVQYDTLVREYETAKQRISQLEDQLQAAEERDTVSPRRTQDVTKEVDESDRSEPQHQYEAPLAESPSTSPDPSNVENTEKSTENKGRKGPIGTNQPASMSSDSFNDGMTSDATNHGTGNDDSNEGME